MYLTYVEIAIIGAVCILCVISLTLVALITLAAGGLMLSRGRGRAG